MVAFCFGTVGGLLTAKVMNKLSGGKINPLIGSAGVSAVPMAARISEDVGREEDPSNTQRSTVRILSGAARAAPGSY